MRNRISAEMLLLAARELRGFAWLRAWFAWLLLPMARREFKRWNQTSRTLQTSFRPSRKPRLIRPMAFATAMSLALVLLFGSAIAVVSVVQARQGKQIEWRNAVFSPAAKPAPSRLD